MDERKAFKFKQFAVFQDKCAMKIGTDGVLLGAWTNTKTESSILDIGTGTGVIALMLAQKSSAKIDAVELDENAALQAKENVSLSRWSDRITVYHGTIQAYAQTSNSTYDLIVSNPPYFTDDLKTPEKARTIARHTDELLFDDLINSVNVLLNPKGTFCTILPVNEGNQFVALAKEKGLFLHKTTAVIPRTNKPSKRLLMAFRFTEIEMIENTTITIEHSKRHEYTDAYKNLTKDYYLAF